MKQIINKYWNFCIISLFVILFSSCSSGEGNKRGLPSVTGQASEVVIVINDTYWSSLKTEIGRTFRAEFPGLPQGEPMFNLINIPNKAFSNIFKTHRNLILTKIGKSEKKSRIVVKEDLYAHPQIVITLIAPDSLAMKKMIIEQRDKLRGIIAQKERDRMIKNYIRYKEQGIINTIKSHSNIDLIIPKGYSIDVEKEDFLWLAHETSEISQGLLIYHYPYKDTSDFSIDSLISKRNQFMKKYVPASREGSYMTTEMSPYPYHRAYMKKGVYIAELRGLWRTVNDFMGGPFVSNSIVDQKNNRIVVVEGFVYAPSKKKRNYMRQLGAIISTMKVCKENEKSKRK